MKKNYKIFDAYTTNSVGVWYFIPADGIFKSGKPCAGFGSIKYAEGSVYVGDIFYDGKNFNKLGCGQQDFSRSDIGGVIEELGEKRYKFAGRYDYRKTDWIYGNGVLYYTDAHGEPTHFKKGFFKGLDKVGEYKGEFDYSSLLKGYTPEMEFDYDENAGRLEARWRQIKEIAGNAQRITALFLGDSYFELADNPEYAGANLLSKRFDKTFVNIGIGGSAFSDWIEWSDKFRDFPAPENIVINLGFNDLHTGRNPERVYRDFLKLLKLLRGYFPASDIYLISVVHSPNHVYFRDAENVYNAKIKANAAKNGVTVVEWNSIIENNSENCFHKDAIHPNERGYGLFGDFIKEFLNRKGE